MLLALCPLSFPKNFDDGAVTKKILTSHWNFTSTSDAQIMVKALFISVFETFCIDHDRQQKKKRKEQLGFTALKKTVMFLAQATVNQSLSPQCQSSYYNCQSLHGFVWQDSAEIRKINLKNECV